MIVDNHFCSHSFMQVISVCSISVGFAFLSCLAYFFMSDKFVSEKAEGFVSIFLLLIWVCGLPIIMNPSRGIAVRPSEDPGINYVSNANLYFFSWAAFACIVYICGSYARANLKQASDAISSVSATPKLGMSCHCSRLIAHAISRSNVGHFRLVHQS